MSNYPDGMRDGYMTETKSSRSIVSAKEADEDTLSLLCETIKLIEAEAAIYRRFKPSHRDAMNKEFRASIAERVKMMRKMAEGLNTDQKFIDIVIEHVAAWEAEDLDIFDLPEVYGQFDAEDMQRLCQRHYQGDYNFHYSEN